MQLQLEKLQLINKENEETLLKFKNEGIGNLNRIVGIDTFESFASNYRKLVTQGLDVTQKKQLAQKFVRKVEVGINSFKLHYIVDNDHYKREISLKKTAHSLGDKGGHSAELSRNLGSNTLTFGTQNRT